MILEKIFGNFLSHSKEEVRFFKEIYSTIQLHIDGFEFTSIQPYNLSVAVEEYILKHFSKIKVDRDPTSPYTVTISFRGLRKVVYQEKKPNVLSILYEDLDQAFMHMVVCLLLVEDSLQSVANMLTPNKADLTTADKKCLEQLIQTTVEMAFQQPTFALLFAEVQKLVAELYPDEAIWSDVFQDIYISVNGTTHRIFINHMYEIPQEEKINSND